MARRAVCFDIMGTVFDLAAARRRLEAIGAPPAALEVWFGRMLHAAAALTLAGAFAPFPEIAAATLRSVLAQLGLDPRRAGEVVASLGELDPYPDAEEALQRLTDAGVPVVALTNGTEQNTRRLLERAGLAAHFQAIVTTAEVEVYKPHRAVYERAVQRLGAAAAGDVTLVAAHAWDVAGARSAGLDAIWISRVERVWPLPVAPVREAADLAGAVDLLLGA